MKRCAHEWREKSFKYIGREAVDRCTKCGRERRVNLVHCPRCHAGGGRPEKDPNCWICEGRGVIRPPHTCKCCGSGGLVAGAALCRDCLWSHGYAGGVCDRESLHDARERRAMGPTPEPKKARVSDETRKRADAMWNASLLTDGAGARTLPEPMIIVAIVIAVLLFLLLMAFAAAWSAHDNAMEGLRQPLWEIAESTERLAKAVETENGDGLFAYFEVLKVENRPEYWSA